MHLVSSVRARFTRDPKGSDCDDAWIRTLYDEYAAGVFTFLMRLTSSERQLCEDIVQETFLRAWRNQAKLKVELVSVRSWLLTVARRILVDECRRRSVRPREVDAELTEYVGVEDGIDALLYSVIVTDALQSLSDKHRAVIHELYFRGSSTAQAAETLGVPRGTVLSRSYYALKALRLALAERGVTSAKVSL